MSVGADPIRNLIQKYIDSPRDNEELEVRFNTLYGSPKLTKIQFDNVMRYLISHGFIKENEEHTLKVFGSFMDATSIQRISNIRTEIRGVPAIQDYCNSSSFRSSDGNLKPNITFTRKLPVFATSKGVITSAKDDEDDEDYGDDDEGKQKKVPLTYDVPKFGFRISYQYEQNLTTKNMNVKQILDNARDNMKIFRMITRVSMFHPDFHGMRVDFSVVRSSAKNAKGHMIMKTNVRDSKVFEQDEEYEIEIELIKDVLLKQKHIGFKPINETSSGEDNAAGSDGSESIGSAAAAATSTLVRKPRLPFVDEITIYLRKLIRYVLSGIQESNYPISFDEIKEIQRTYVSIIRNKLTPEELKSYRLRPRDFVGPSSISLEVGNIVPLSEDTILPNIRIPYTVTDKADGQRKLMIISNSPSTLGRIYLIDTNMNVQYTGCLTTNEKLFGSILDGEHVLHDRNEEFINLYLVFDIYYVNKTDIRGKPFYLGTAPKSLSADVEGTAAAAADTDSAAAMKKKYDNVRMIIMNRFVKELTNPETLRKDDKKTPVSHFTIKTKKFYYSSGDDGGNSIFRICNEILNKIRKEEEEDEFNETPDFPYLTDGLIFTPAKFAVGADKEDVQLEPIKRTWDYSFKWKPPKFNSVDFLVSVKKTPDGLDMIGNKFETGIDMSSMNQIKQYKTLILKVGYDVKKHGYLNPCHDVITGELPEVASEEMPESDYAPIPFYPTLPSDPNAHICHVMLTTTAIGPQMLTEGARDVIEDNMIVEFAYNTNPDLQDGWKWTPIRVRYDKTAEYRRGLKNYGNAYHVANSVWHSIHNPVSEEMIRTGMGIPEMTIDDDVYYQRSGTSLTRPLRDFHNLYVKRILIKKVADTFSGFKTLIDMGVGKAGDLPKWINANIGFVFGIDVAADNIENRIDGACARYLNMRRKTAKIPRVLFTVGDCAKNIRNGDALATETGRKMVNAIFGVGSKDRTLLEKGIYDSFGVVKDGFKILSSQFAIHYYFESKETLFGFIRNLSECAAIGGKFVCTSYDGKEVFKLLKTVPYEDSVRAMKDDKKIWEIRKKYTQTEFPNTVESVGLQIDVYQESINKVFPEYLVNYEYLSRVMELFGFEMVESRAFRDLFKEMQITISKQDAMQREGKLIQTPLKTEVGLALELTKHEEQMKLSFLNKYAIYEKKFDIDPVRVEKELLSSSDLDSLLTAMKSEKRAVVSAVPAAAVAKPPAPKSDSILPPERLPAANLFGQTLVSSTAVPAVSPVPVVPAVPAVSSVASATSATIPRRITVPRSAIAAATAAARARTTAAAAATTTVAPQTVEAVPSATSGAAAAAAAASPTTVETPTSSVVSTPAQRTTIRIPRIRPSLNLTDIPSTKPPSST